MYEIISKENFNSITEYVGPRPIYLNQNYGYKKEGNDLVFSANFICCPCVYYYKTVDDWCYSFDPDLVANYFKSKGVLIPDDYSNFEQVNKNLREHIKPSIKKHYKYKLEYIEGWKQIFLHQDGNFEVIKNDFVPFQLDYKNHFEEFKNLLIKYKNIVNKYIDEKLFLPTITGGVDTRGLIWFYRNRISELDGYFLTSVKQDGRNHVEQGQLEMKLAEQVVKKIGLKNNRINKLEDCDKPYVTLSGFFNENADLYDNPADIDYIYKVVQHAWDSSHQFINKLTIFIDDDFLKFKPNSNFKWIVLIMNKDLLLIPIVSGTSLYRHYQEGACLASTFSGNLNFASELLQRWGPEAIEELNKIYYL